MSQTPQVAIISGTSVGNKQQIPFFATSIGASIDSFYRSAMNSILNAQLTNKKGSLFPNMHIQMPVRIFYLNGIKNLRVFIDQNKQSIIDRSGYDRRLIETGLIISPGLVMTPFSSILEASNAGHMVRLIIYSLLNEYICVE
jgi:hypothetical protein